MTLKRTLYQVLQVNRQAGAEVIRAAYEARLRALGDSAAPEIAAERALARDALEVLGDPVRRALYDEKLREEARRALASGGEPGPRARAAPLVETESLASRISPLGWMIGIAMLGLVAVAGSWVYSDYQDKREAQRLAAERRAADERAREELAERRREALEAARERTEANRAAYEKRREESQRLSERRRWEQEQERSARQARYEAQKSEAEQRRAEAEARRLEQENLRQQQLQLERERRYLREVERERQLRF